MARIVVLYEGREEESNQVVEGVNQTSDVPDKVQQAVRLADRDLFLVVDLQMQTPKLVESFRIFYQVVAPGARELLIEIYLMVFYLINLAKLNIVCLIFELLHHKVEIQKTRRARIKLHFIHA